MNIRTRGVAYNMNQGPEIRLTTSVLSFVDYRTPSKRLMLAQPMFLTAVGPRNSDDTNLHSPYPS